MLIFEQALEDEEEELKYNLSHGLSNFVNSQQSDDWANLSPNLVSSLGDHLESSN
jgi:hypothetical protein